MDIGYLATDQKYYCLARSNIVKTSPASAADTIDENWDDIARNCDEIYAQSGGNTENFNIGDLKELFEERLRRPMGSPIVTRFGVGAEGGVQRESNFKFEVDAELIVYGIATSGTHLEVKGQPIELREDGSFTVRMSLPNKRQVVPVVATRADGVEQRTTVLAVERNTKVMETVIRDADDAVGRR